MNLDQFYMKQYDKNNYNCCHFACDVWKELTGKDISNVFKGFMRSDKKAVYSDLKRLTPRGNNKYCIVLFQNRQSAWNHIGIYIEGKIFHITKESVEYKPLDIVMIGYKKVRFYTC